MNALHLHEKFFSMVSGFVILPKWGLSQKTCATHVTLQLIFMTGHNIQRQKRIRCYYYRKSEHTVCSIGESFPFLFGLFLWSFFEEHVLWCTQHQQKYKHLSSLWEKCATKIRNDNFCVKKSQFFVVHLQRIFQKYTNRKCMKESESVCFF